MSADRAGTRRHGDRGLSGEKLRHAVEVVTRAFSEFLLVPTVVIAGFLLLALLTYFLDQKPSPPTGEEIGLFGTRLFSSYETSRDLLATIAGGIITVTSITFSLLLIAVQQGAASLTSVVFDQFLRRWTNQFYFGFFLGLALFCLVNLATTTPVHNPIFGLTIAFAMTVVTLYMLVLLIYTTVDQARPAVIVEAIHDHTLRAWDSRRSLVARTRRTTRLSGVKSLPVTARGNGFLADVDLELWTQAAEEAGCDVEFAIRVSLGDYVSYGDPFAEITMGGTADRAALEQAVLAALPLEGQRDLDNDPALGIQQLGIIGWTSISTAKSNPEPGLLVCWALRDLLGRQLVLRDDVSSGEPAPVVYPDTVLDSLLNALESLTIVASESMQHQTIAALYDSFETLYPRLTPDLKDRVDELLMRSLSGLGDHVLSHELDAALGRLVDALDLAGRAGVAEAVASARRQLAGTVGRLHARSTRVSGSN